MILSNGLRDRETEAGSSRFAIAGLLRTIEWFQNPLEVIGRETWPMIANLDGDVSILGPNRYLRGADAGGGLSGNYLNWTDEGSGQGSAYATGSNGPPEDLEFIFTPASGFEVSLSSVETWVNGGVTPVLATYTLFNGDQLVSTTPFAASPEPIGVPHTVTSFSEGYFSGPLRLHVSPASSRGISFDNITLNSRAIAVNGAVPEPSTWALMISGLGLTGAALRRRRATPSALA